MLRFSNEWLRDKIASDPDVECEAGKPLYSPSSAMPDGTTFGDYVRQSEKGKPMTTTIKVHVNGRYRAIVVKSDMHGVQEPVIVEGNYEGSPNPSGEKSFWLSHPAEATFKISEEQVPE